MPSEQGAGFPILGRARAWGRLLRCTWPIRTEELLDSLLLAFLQQPGQPDVDVLLRQGWSQGVLRALLEGLSQPEAGRQQEPGVCWEDIGSIRQALDRRLHAFRAGRLLGHARSGALGLSRLEQLSRLPSRARKLLAARITSAEPEEASAQFKTWLAEALAPAQDGEGEQEAAAPEGPGPILAPSRVEALLKLPLETMIRLLAREGVSLWLLACKQSGGLSMVQLLHGPEPNGAAPGEETTGLGAAEAEAAAAAPAPGPALEEEGPGAPLLREEPPWEAVALDRLEDPGRRSAFQALARWLEALRGCLPGLEAGLLAGPREIWLAPG